ncbi:MAG: class I SAM-dependent RNA methyltransferase [Thermoanaerobaculia bacterium]|nr:class I SAM-dependent RNA methyltransferase [Thermoanaerobaculia bacterium]
MKEFDEIATESEAAPRGLALALVEEFEITVEKLVAGGEGLGRYQGVPVFVPRSAPGDRLRVRLVERKSDYGRAEIVEILEAGPGRREPPCPYFVHCGGCDLQHLEENRQVEFKAAAVRETLLRLGGISLPRNTEIIAGKPWGYRVRAQIHSKVIEEARDPESEDATTDDTGEEEVRRRVQVGYHRRGSNDLVAIDQCRILVPELEAMIPHLPGAIPLAGPRRLDLLAGDDRLTTAPPVEGLPQGEVKMTVGEFSYLLDARCFFQAHRTLTPVLVNKAIGAWTGGVAVDLYAGVGLLTLPLARRYENVLAVEGSNVSVRFARKNARRNGLPGIEVMSQAVESYVAKGLPANVDRIVVDPPRSGLSKVVRRALLEAKAGRLTYVSCHPATLARDLRALTEEIYELESLVLIDLFPQSGHMEVVAQLARR